MDRRLQELVDAPSWEWPESAAETLRGILRDRKAASEDRFAAAELAGDLVVIDDEGVDLLLSIIARADEPDELRARAAIALGPVLETADWGDFDDPVDEVPITEETFDRTRDVLRKLYQDTRVPKQVRRRILEAAVRSPQDWQAEAIRAAYASGDDEWKLTAVFGMRWVRGFDDQILESLDSPNADMHYEAVCGAGNWELDAAWEHVAELAESEETEKNLRLAAIEAVGTIRPEEAADILLDLAASEDEDIAEAAREAMSTAESAQAYTEDEEDEDEDDGDRRR